MDDSGRPAGRPENEGLRSPQAFSTLGLKTKSFESKILYIIETRISQGLDLLQIAFTGITAARLLLDV